MGSGIICLKELYVYARENEISFRDQEYTRIKNRLIRNVPKETGWYLWVKMDEIGDETNYTYIYIGKAKRSIISSLNYRLGQELSNERMLFWEEISLEQRENIERTYPYANFERGERKEGSTHIVWVSDPSCKERKLRDIELLLIGMFDPTANNQLVRTVEDAKDIKDKMKETLRGNEMRPRVMA